MDASDGRTPGTTGRLAPPELIPREFLRVIAVWSLIPSYLVAGGLFGYFGDQWAGTFPYITGVALLCALGLAIRDMLRLRSEM